MAKTKVQFAQNLIRYLPVYLGTSLGDIAKGSPYSRIYLYKLADGSAPVNQGVNEALNDFWNDRELTADDLSNIYSLIDLIECGSKKEKQYQLRQHKKAQGGN